MRRKSKEWEKSKSRALRFRGPAVGQLLTGGAAAFVVKSGLTYSDLQTGATPSVV